MKMWLKVLLNVLTGELIANGKSEQAQIITDALAAVDAGKDVDATMAAAAAAWEGEGEPTFDAIAESRRRIQERVG